MPTHERAIGEIAAERGVPVHRIAYIIRARNIKPDRWTAGIRLFGSKTVKQIDAELRAIAAQQEKQTTVGVGS